MRNYGWWCHQPPIRDLAHLNEKRTSIIHHKPDTDNNQSRSHSRERSDPWSQRRVCEAAAVVAQP